MESNRASKLGVVISTSLLVFTFCIFGPFQIYITNVSELFFSFGDIWWICALTALVSGAVIIGIGLLLKGKLREFYCCALWGLALALYIQGNFILTDYGTLDGSIDWGNYRGVGIWNSILWIALITLPFLLYQFVPQLWKFARNYAALVILGMQVVTLCTLFLTVDGDSNSNFQLTNRGKLELSKNENIIVFVLDTYDGQYFSDFIEQYPEYKETLWKDFTFYPDTVGGGTRTILGMPQILTGQYCTSDGPFSKYLEDGYQSTSLYRELNHARYNIGVYTAGHFMPPSMKNLVMNLSAGKQEIKSYPLLTYYLYRLTACQYFPHKLKRNIWMYTEDFDAAADNSGSESSTYLTDNALFYKEIVEKGLTLNDMNAFRLYHLSGTHPPYTLDAQAQKNVEGTSLEQQQKGLMHILEVYFEQMKRLGIYDNANIIILADHGDLNLAQNPIFLVKKGQETEEFTINDTPISYANLHPTLLSFIQKDDVNGESIFELTTTDNKERFFYVNQADRTAIEYVIRGHAADPDNAHETGRIFSVFADKEPDKYQLGTMLYFDARKTGLQYAIKGFSRAEIEHTWTNGHEVILSIPLEDTSFPKDIFTSISFKFVRNSRQRVGIYINETFLNDYLVNTNELNFTIPKEMLTEKNLTIRFELPDATQTGTTDPRILALGFESMVIRELQEIDKESIRFSRDYHPGDRILFTKEDDGRRYFESGVSGIEKDFAWSLGNFSQIILNISEPPSNLIGEIQFKSIYAGPQKLVIRSAGQTLYDEEVVSTNDSVQFLIPEKCLQNGRLILDLEYPNAISPFDRTNGNKQDTRPLAFAFSSIRFYEDQ